jgi:hypothetical protein
MIPTSTEDAECPSNRERLYEVGLIEEEENQMFQTYPWQSDDMPEPTD